MTKTLIDIAARKWRLRLDTQTIAQQMRVREFQVYRHLEEIKARARQMGRAA
jgi:hypothetical protein